MLCSNWAPSSLEPVHLNLQNKISNVQVKEIVCCECERDGKRRLECKKETSSRFKYNASWRSFHGFFLHFCFEIVGISAIRIFVIRKISRLEATTSCSVLRRSMSHRHRHTSSHKLLHFFFATLGFYWLNKQSLVSVSVCWELHIFSRSLVLILSGCRLSTTTWRWTATSERIKKIKKFIIMLSSRNVNDTDSESYERPHDDMMSYALIAVRKAVRYLKKIEWLHAIIRG